MTQPSIHSPRITRMTSSSQPAFPQAALAWLTPEAPQPQLLVLGRASAPLASALASTDARLVACDTSRGGLRTLLNRAPLALPTVAQPERLPFAPFSFDAVYVHQSLHNLSAGALAELARVMAPGGHLSVSYTVRDDSVPWVRRLTALLRDVDPNAMAGSYGTDSIDRVEACPYFADIQSRRHRLWIPISRVDLLDMVARRFPDLEQDRFGQLMADVGRLYETSARVPEPLLLPYQVVCWKAVVDHEQFTTPIELPEDGLPIPL